MSVFWSGHVGSCWLAKITSQDQRLLIQPLKSSIHMKQFGFFCCCWLNSHLCLMTDEDVRYPVNSKRGCWTVFASGGGIDSCCAWFHMIKSKRFSLVWLNITFLIGNDCVLAHYRGFKWGSGTVWWNQSAAVNATRSPRRQWWAGAVLQSFIWKWQHNAITFGKATVWTGMGQSAELKLHRTRASIIWASCPVSVSAGFRGIKLARQTANLCFWFRRMGV